MGCVYSRACIGEICAPKDGGIKHTHSARPAETAEIAVFSPQSSSSGGEDEGRDHVNSQLSLEDHELGIMRLSRVSSQFLPPNG